MNCGRSAGTVENPARPRISATHTAATTAAEGAAGMEVAELTVYLFCVWAYCETARLIPGKWYVQLGAERSGRWREKKSGFHTFAHAQCQHGKGQSQHRL